MPVVPAKAPGRYCICPGAFTCCSLAERGLYFSAHSQKFHQTPVWFGMNFTPVMRSL